MSAKWRRNKKRSGRFSIFRTFSRGKDGKFPQAFRISNSKIKRRIYPYKYRLPRIYRERKWKDPEPLTDILEENDEIIVVAEFAGFKNENLKIYVKGQRLTLSAKAFGRKYYKSLNLPKRVNPETLRTKYKNGVLEIRLKQALEEELSKKVVG